MKRSHVNVILLLAVLLVSAPVNVWGQDSSRERTFGTASLVSHTLGAYAFTGDAVDSARFAGSPTLTRARFCSGAPCNFSAPLLLPAGAVVTAIALAACDSSPRGLVRVRLLRNVDPEVSQTNLLQGEQGQAGPGDTPGCGVFSFPLAVPETIDNVHNTYTVTVSMSSEDSSTRFFSVRIFYHLQVSPPPVTPTFNDVPANHGFFQFIEALVAAGITGGCSANPPLYCPDNFVTRGQMAVFLSRALGLHFE